MGQYSATESGVGYNITEQDADGVGKIIVHVSDRGLDRSFTEKAARLLVLAANIEGGWDKAIELLRGEVIRQKES